MSDPSFRRRIRRLTRSLTTARRVAKTRRRRWTAVGRATPSLRGRLRQQNGGAGIKSIGRTCLPNRTPSAWIGVDLTGKRDVHQAAQARPRSIQAPPRTPE